MSGYIYISVLESLEASPNPDNIDIESHGEGRLTAGAPQNPFPIGSRYYVTIANEYGVIFESVTGHLRNYALCHVIFRNITLKLTTHGVHPNRISALQLWLRRQWVARGARPSTDMLCLHRLYPFIACLLTCRATVYDFEKLGGKPDDDSSQTAWANGGLVNKTLQAILQPGDTLFFPNKTFTLMGGIQAEGLHDITIQIDGTLEYKDDIDSWPTQDGKQVLNCMVFKNVTNMTFTSSGKGTIDGKGERWWGIPGIGYLIQGKNRPNLFEIDTGKDVLIENLLFKQSPCLTVWAHNMDGLEIRWTDIDARRTDADSHTIIDLTAFNTDGFDVAGKNVWIHDCNVWNQDDCVCVKGNSENMLFERINASGLGLVPS
eukprot:1393977-Amorphochlora_amoeboformis.AAC.1